MMSFQYSFATQMSLNGHGAVVRFRDALFLVFHFEFPAAGVAPFFCVFRPWSPRKIFLVRLSPSVFTCLRMKGMALLPVDAPPNKSRDLAYEYSFDSSSLNLISFDFSNFF